MFLHFLLFEIGTKHVPFLNKSLVIEKNFEARNVKKGDSISLFVSGPAWNLPVFLANHQQGYHNLQHRQ